MGGFKHSGAWLVFVIIGAMGAAVVSSAGADAAIRVQKAAFSSKLDMPNAATVESTATAASLLDGFDPANRELEEGRFVVGLAGGRRANLSLDPELQNHIEAIYRRYEVPFASLVALDPRDGRVLAYVSHSSAAPNVGDLARDATPPTASVFKIITAAALIDAGVSPDERVCYRGGAGRILERHLDNDPSASQCATLSEALGRSINPVFAHLADAHLDGATLSRYASAFGFGHSLPFDIPLPASPAEIPTDRLERARTAAGFWHMHMSPMHGALIAATIAADGTMPRASIVDSIDDVTGNRLYEFEPAAHRSVIPRRTAQAVARMMENTTTRGTARRIFRDEQGNHFLPGIRVAGKTGTLSAERPYRGYTWFVGFAPADNPTIAVASLVVNTPRWRIKAAFVAREALRWYLVAGPRQAAREAAAQEADEAAETSSDSE